MNIPYVQDLIEARGDEVCELLLKQKGHFYVCGDGQAMVKQVHDSLVTAIATKLQSTSAQAEAKLTEIATEGRYCREVWN